jgi:hypothetical protein
LYNDSAVKIYYATSSQVRFESKNIFFYICKNATAYYITGVGLAPEVMFSDRKCLYHVPQKGFKLLSTGTAYIFILVTHASRYST